MNALPPNIEKYLCETGFTSTEILVLKRLLEGEALTLREIAAKTGKSTGVLDQAAKKLLRKRIVGIEGINDTSKFSLSSLDAIVRWVAEDTREKRESLLKKHQNFETFIKSLQVGKKRPEMEHFEGEEGICKAYRRLLELGKEIRVYVPDDYPVDNPAFRECLVEFFRERKRRNIFSRVVAHNTAFGRKFQGRDPFEYRQTLLVDADQYPFSFEKVIVGDTVASIDHHEKRACFIHYPQIAASEQAFFDAIWTRESQKSGTPVVAVTAQETKPASIPLHTRTLSNLREFFLSKTSLAWLGGIAVISMLITYGLYSYTEHLTLQGIRDRVMSIAATGALQFEPKDLEQLRTIADIGKPEYAKVIGKLNEIRNQNPGVKYMYILRPKEEKDMYEFVADADSLDPTVTKDLNNDGLIDIKDHLSPPGELYRDTDPAFGEHSQPTASSAPVTDQWGTFISGWAPIKDDSGKTVAILGVDKFAEDVQRISRENFTPIFWVVGIFVLFILVRLLSHWDLCKGMFSLMTHKDAQPAALEKTFEGFYRFFLSFKSIVIFLAFGLCAAAITYGLYRYTASLNLERMKEQAKSIAITAAPQFDAKDLDQLQVEEDWRKPEWGKVVKQLLQVRLSNQDVFFAYIFRKSSSDPHQVTFVADSHSLYPYANTDTDLANDVDLDRNGKIDSMDTLQWPGQYYPDVPEEAFLGFEGPTTNKDFYEDSWGKYISGYAPIFNQSGSTVAVLAIDIKASKLKELTAESFAPLFWFFLFFVALIFIRLIAFHRQLFKGLWDMFHMRKVLLVLALCAELSFGITYVQYRHTLSVMKEEIGNRLMSIAATAAPEIDAKDLEQLRWARDMKTEAYQRVFQKLNDVRRQNKNIKWAYIYRRAEKPEFTIFIADADSNYNLPDWIDWNEDGIRQSEENNFGPGLWYQANRYGHMTDAFNKPIAESELMTDQWGTFMSGYAPIKDKTGRSVAIIGLDMDVSDVLIFTRQKFSVWLWFSAFCSAFLLVWVIVQKNTKHISSRHSL